MVRALALLTVAALLAQGSLLLHLHPVIALSLTLAFGVVCIVVVWLAFRAKDREAAAARADHVTHARVTAEHEYQAIRQRQDEFDKRQQEQGQLIKELAEKLEVAPRDVLEEVRALRQAMRCAEPPDDKSP